MRLLDQHVPDHERLRLQVKLGVSDGEPRDHDRVGRLARKADAERAQGELSDSGGDRECLAVFRQIVVAVQVELARRQLKRDLAAADVGERLHLYAFERKRAFRGERRQTEGAAPVDALAADRPGDERVGVALASRAEIVERERDRLQRHRQRLGPRLVDDGRFAATHRELVNP